MNDQSGGRSLIHKVGMLNLVLALLAFTTMAFCFSGVIAQPLSVARVGAYLPMLLAGAILFNRLFAITNRLIGPPKRRVIRVLRGIAHLGVTIVLPLFLMSLVENIVIEKSMTLISQHFAQTIEEAEQHIKATGALPQTLKTRPSRNGKAIAFTYSYGKDAYAIETAGGSIDIDGSTIFYLSTTRVWNRVHNDIKTSGFVPQYFKRYMEAKAGMTSVGYR